MIGRERELELLLEGLDALPSGRGRLFLLTGSPASERHDSPTS
jgi:hypothetical protein